MPSYYWIKLYHEILDDPKMGRMPDRLYRRTIELFLLAGETDKDGYLPEFGDIAWRLHISEDELTSDLQELSSLGIVHNDSGQWCVTNFSARQGAASNAERQKRYRERQRTSNEGVTERNADIDIDKDIDKELREEEAQPTNALDDLPETPQTFDDALVLLETALGILATPDDTEMIHAFIGEGHTKSDLIGAIQWRVSEGLSSVKHIHKILPGVRENKRQRVQKTSAKSRSNGRPAEPAPTAEEIAKAAAAFKE